MPLIRTPITCRWHGHWPITCHGHGHRCHTMDTDTDYMQLTRTQCCMPVTQLACHWHGLSWHATDTDSVNRPMTQSQLTCHWHSLSLTCHWHDLSWHATDTVWVDKPLTWSQLTRHWHGPLSKPFIGDFTAKANVTQRNENAAVIFIEMFPHWNLLYRRLCLKYNEPSLNRLNDRNIVYQMFMLLLKFTMQW